MLAFGAALVASAGVAHAEDYPVCDREVTESDVKGAKGAHEAAQVWYRKGKYEQAVDLWRQAYDFDCTAHLLLVNIGNAYEKMAETEKAVAAFDLYLERTGDKADPAIQEKVDNLKQMLANRPPPAPVPNPDPKPEPKPFGPPDTSGSNPAPWLVVGAGGVMVVVGAILIPVGLSDISKAEERCPPSVANPDERDCSLDPERDPEGAASLGNGGRVKVAVGGGLIGGGVAAIGAGVLWHFLTLDDEEPAPPSPLEARPVLTPGFAGLSLHGHF